MKKPDFYKIVNGKEWLDFHKIMKEDYPMNLIVSERGLQGKTFNAKEFILDEWLSKGLKTTWLLNTGEQWKEERKYFLQKSNETYPDKWADITISKQGLLDKKGELFCKFVALSTSGKLKGSRPTNKYIFYDEFNVGLIQIGDKQTFLLLELINTLSTPGKTNDTVAFIFGNKKSLNVPLLTDLNITKLDDEVEYINNNKGLKLMMIYSPIGDAKQIDDEYQKNWLYETSKITGLHKYSFLNQSIFDNDNNIISINEFDFTGYNETEYLLKIEDKYFKHFHNKITRQSYMVKVDKPDPYINVVASRKKDMDGNTELNEELRWVLIIELQKTNRIFFDCLATKIKHLKLL